MFNSQPEACEYRLLILESIAGVPGMVAGSVRHFNSLRHMKRDHGWIHTLLEEAENERMHLLICMKMFQPSMPVRAVVIAAQMGLLPILTAVYVVKVTTIIDHNHNFIEQGCFLIDCLCLQPKAMHRFVGYLEETAVET